jgi:hypothetical protein
MNDFIPHIVMHRLLLLYKISTVRVILMVIDGLRLPHVDRLQTVYGRARPKGALALSFKNDH